MIKKQQQISYLTLLFELGFFLGFLTVNKFTHEEKTVLKKELHKIGLQSKVLKNKLSTHIIKSKHPQYVNMLPLIQGFCLIIYPSSKIKDVGFDEIKEFGLFLEKNPNYIFLGGFYKNTFINKVFFQEALALKSRLEIYSRLLRTLLRSCSTFNVTFNNSTWQITGNPNIKK